MEMMNGTITEVAAEEGTAVVAATDKIIVAAPKETPKEVKKVLKKSVKIAKANNEEPATEKTTAKKVVNKPKKAVALKKVVKKKVPKKVVKKVKKTVKKPKKSKAAKKIKKVKFRSEEITDRQKKVLAILKRAQKQTIAELAEKAFSSVRPKAKANSWVRNQLRGLVARKLVAKIDSGTYKARAAA